MIDHAGLAVRIFALRLAGAWVAVMLLCLSGCQSLLYTTPIPKVSARDQKEIKLLAKQDAFPTPEQVGLQQ